MEEGIKAGQFLRPLPRFQYRKAFDSSFNSSYSLSEQCSSALIQTSPVVVLTQAGANPKARANLKVRENPKIRPSLAAVLEATTQMTMMSIAVRSNDYC